MKMPRPAKKKEKTRLNLELSADARKRLEALQVATDADSMGEVVRRALSLYEMVTDELGRKSSRLVVIRDDGSEVELRVI